MRERSRLTRLFTVSSNAGNALRVGQYSRRQASDAVVSASGIAECVEPRAV